MTLTSKATAARPGLPADQSRHRAVAQPHEHFHGELAVADGPHSVGVVVCAEIGLEKVERRILHPVPLRRGLAEVAVLEHVPYAGLARRLAFAVHDGVVRHEDCALATQQQSFFTTATETALAVKMNQARAPDAIDLRISTRRIPPQSSRR